MQTQLNKKLAQLLNESNKVTDKVLKGYEKQLIDNYKSVLSQIKDEVLWLYEKMGGNPSFQDANRYNRLSQLEKQIAEAVKNVNGKNIKLTTDAIKDTFEDSYYQTGYAFEQGLGAKLGVNALTYEVINASVINPLDRITWIDRSKGWGKKLTQEISDTLTQGLIKGDTYSTVARELGNKVNIDLGRAMRIVRTEAGRAQSAASKLSTDKAMQSAERLGIKMERKWLSILDSSTRHDHRYMNGKTADKEGLYTFPNGAKTKGPRLSGIAKEDINCRCTEITEIVSMPKKYQPKEDFGSFTDWKATRAK